MLNIMLSGIGGQGTVLAAKLLASCAQSRGWRVRTAETIGMAQRGGNVTSHVRIANNGEQIYSPLVARETADLIVAFEPAEGVRMLPYLSSSGILITATSPVQPVTVALSGKAYDYRALLDDARASLQPAQKLIEIDDAAITDKAGTRRVLNCILLAAALKTGAVPFSIDDLAEAIRSCVKPAFVDLNLSAIQLVAQ